jgi:carboxymethylenebutenolidase
MESMKSMELGRSMKRLVTMALTAVLATPVLAQQAAGMAQTPARAGGAPQGPAYTAPKNEAVPPADPYVDDALKTSPRHGEWVDIKTASGATIKTWLEYPSATGKRGVVIVIHEIYGLTDWVRGVADQVAKDGFIAMAPDLISGMGPNGGGSAELGTQGAGQVIRTLTNDERAARLNAVMAYGKSIPSSNGKTAVVGFCWGGGSSLSYAISQPGLNAAVMYYGPAPTLPNSQTPDLSGLPNVKAPILAHYPGNDAHTLSSAQPISDEMKKLGKSFEFFVYDGAAHGFMHQRSEADYAATVASWPRTMEFFSKHLK